MDANRLIEIIEKAGYEARSYSGRGMYGRHCVGVEIERGVSGFKLALDLSSEADDDERYLLGELNVSEDSMGLDQIVYFPYVEWPKDRAEDEEDADD